MSNNIQDMYSEKTNNFFRHLPEVKQYDPKTVRQEELDMLVKLYRKKFTDLNNGELYHFSSFRSANMIRPYGSRVFVFPQPRYLPTVPHFHDYYEFGILLEGECRHFVQNVPLQMNAGDVILIPPGTKHQSVMLTEHGTWLDLGIRSDEIADVLPHLWKETNPFLSFIHMTKDIVSERAYAHFHVDAKILSDIIELCFSEDANFHDPLYILKKEVIAEMVATELSQCNDAFFQYDVFTSVTAEEEIIRYIQGHFQSITRKKVAELFSYSERQITRIVQKNTGMSFQRYLGDLRMDYILDMLENTLAPIHGIIESAGYYDNNNFFRLFRKRFGMTPGEYRKERQSLF